MEVEPLETLTRWWWWFWWLDVHGMGSEDVNLVNRINGFVISPIVINGG